MKLPRSVSLTGCINLRRATLTCLLVVGVLAPLDAIAEIVSEKVAIQGIPLAQWIVVVDRGESELIPAESRLEAGVIDIFAEVGTLRPTALVGGIVHLADGRILSSPLHPGPRDTLNDASAELAATQAAELTTSIELKRAKVVELEQQIQDINADLRHRAGLDDVDKIAAEALHLRTLAGKMNELRLRAAALHSPRPGNSF